MKILTMKKIRARNFMCYGNSWVEFNIREGITQILGENGNGKSTIFEIMYFVLFNTPFRPKITKADLINDQNMKQLETEMSFDVTENEITDSYVISRGMKPDYFKIIKNGVEQNTASSAVNQEALRTVITSISEGVFTSSVGLSPITAKPIIEMSAEERRSASSEMFSMKDIDLYRSKIKEKISASRLDETILTSKLQTLYTSIISLKSAIEEHNKSNIQAIAAKEEHLRVKVEEYYIMYNNYSLLKGEYDAAAAAHTEYISTMSGLNKDIISSSILGIVSSISVNNTKKVQLTNKVKAVVPGEKCSYCKEKLSHESAEAHVKEIELEIELISQEIQRLENKLASEREAYTKALGEYTEEQRLKKIKDDAYSKLDGMVGILNEKNNTINDIKANIADMYSKANSNNDKVHQDLLNAENEYTANSAKLASIRATNEIDLNLSKVFADDGLKAYVISNYMNNFNSAVNRYLGIIGLPVSITFNDKFDHVMKSGVGIGKKYYALSTGQRQRLNLAIALAVVDLTMAIGRLKCNVLFLDEIADIAMDDSGMSSFLGIINSISRRDNKAIILISHKNMDVIKGSKDLINYSYEAVRIDGNFSSLVEVKNKRAAPV